MEVLFWLVPALGVTLAAMVWVSWHGRDPREVDRETAARRIGEALARQEKRSTGYAAPRRTPDRASGVKVRRHTTGGAGAEDGPEQRAS